MACVGMLHISQQKRNTIQLTYCLFFSAHVSSRGRNSGKSGCNGLSNRSMLYTLFFYFRT